ncbi:MAG TPA: hypothetical protein VK981_16115 [Ramlibacter sp.]|nr:hypothetical protein [Ramlibacter sp.]
MNDGDLTQAPLRALLFASLLAAGPAWAAGGHHAVDDAAILEPGACEVEGWYKQGSGRVRLAHAGLNCRVGPVELGAASEHERDPSGRATAHGLQAKWATELAPKWNVGISVAPAWQAHVQPRYLGATVAGLLTWAAREDLTFHANLGRDLLHQAGDEKRYGAAVEWTPIERWSLMAERYFEAATHAVRAGVRWSVSDTFTVDLSHAHRISGTRPSHWTLGATWSFER